jgi:hypothetical protein
VQRTCNRSRPSRRGGPALGALTLTGMWTRRVALLQGAYYIVSGLWPIVSLRSFEWVTGPKTDGWLVKMVGLLAAVIGAVLAGRAARGEQPDIALGVGSAAAFGVIDVVYASRGRISPIYLADAAGEAALIGAWAAGARVDRQAERTEEVAAA